MQQQCNEIDSVCFPRVYILVLLPAVDMERENQNHGGLYVDYTWRPVCSALNSSSRSHGNDSSNRTQNTSVYTYVYIYIYWTNFVPVESSRKQTMANQQRLSRSPYRVLSLTIHMRAFSSILILSLIFYSLKHTAQQQQQSIWHSFFCALASSASGAQR
jgi:hypothetical protein